MIELKFSLAGFLVGFLVGLTGMGGAALMTPLLIFLKVPPMLAVGTDLGYASITKIFGAWQHYRQKTVSISIAGYLLIGAIPTALLGVWFLTFLRNSYGSDVDIFTKKALGVVLVVVAVSLLLHYLIKVGNGEEKENLVLSSGQKLSTLVWGAVVGFLVGLTSVGSGSLIIPFLAFFYHLPTRKVVGTNVFQAAVVLSVAGLAHLRAGNIDLPLVGILLVGSIPGVVVGSRLTLKTSDKFLKIILALVLFIVGLKLV